jgi:DNA-binding PadR family transcriptional regulator
MSERKPTEKQPEVDAQLPLTPLSFHILLALAEGEKHGYGILKEIEHRTDGKMRTASGALYLAAVRLEDGGLIEESERRPDPELDDKRRRYYRLTDLGRRVAAAEAERMSQLLGAAFDIGLVRGARPEVRMADQPEPTSVTQEEQ